MQLAGRLRQPVMHPQPFLAADHQSPLPEIRQMAGHRGLRQVERLMQVADADLAVRQQIQQPQPHRIGERLEEFDRIIQGIGVCFFIRIAEYSRSCRSGQPRSHDALSAAQHPDRLYPDIRDDGRQARIIRLTRFSATPHATCPNLYFQRTKRTPGRH